jgi:putative hydrolase of the HAD superfamily
VLTDALQAMCDELAESSPDKAREAEELIHTISKGFMSIEEGDIAMSKLFGITREDYVKRKYGGETRNEPLLKYIAGLRKEYKTAMLSNVSNGGLLRRFGVEELNEYFDATVASAEIGFAKPEPQAYEITADKLGVRLTECIFIDDREAYCDGARGVGMKAIVYSSFNQLKSELSRMVAS